MFKNLSMNPPEINLDNYKLLAAKNYYRVKFTTDEFTQDIALVLSIKKALSRYKSKDSIQVRVVLNKIIVLCNVFQPEFTVRVLFLIIPKEHYSYITPFLKFLNILPNIVRNIDGNDIVTSEISVNNFILKELENL